MKKILLLPEASLIIDELAYKDLPLKLKFTYSFEPMSPLNNKHLFKWRVVTDPIEGAVHDTEATYSITMEKALIVKKEAKNAKIFKKGTEKEIINLKKMGEKVQLSGESSFFTDKVFGKTLKELNLNKYTLESLCLLMLECFNELSTLHEQGFTHGDIREQNIIYNTSNKKIQFVDWETLNDFAFEEGKSLDIQCMAQILLRKWEHWVQESELAKNTNILLSNEGKIKDALHLIQRGKIDELEKLNNILQEIVGKNNFYSSNNSNTFYTQKNTIVNGDSILHTTSSEKKIL